MNEDYVAGFMAKAAALGVDPEGLVKQGARGDQLMKLIQRQGRNYAAEPAAVKKYGHPIWDRFLELKRTAGGLSEASLAPSKLFERFGTTLRAPTPAPYDTLISDLAKQMRKVRGDARLVDAQRAIDSAGAGPYKRLRSVLNLAN